MITPDCEELADSQFRVVCSVPSCPIQPWEERALAGEGAASRQVASAGRSEAGRGQKALPSADDRLGGYNRVGGPERKELPAAVFEAQTNFARANWGSSASRHHAVLRPVVGEAGGSGGQSARAPWQRLGRQEAARPMGTQGAAEAGLCEKKQ